MPRSWSLVDFVLVVLGGFVGAGIFAVIIVLADNSEFAIVLGLAGQYVGHLFVFWLIARNREEADVGFRVEASDFKYLPLGFFLQLVLALAFLPLASLLFPEGDQAQQISDFISDLQGGLARVGAIAVAVVLAPITEELIFRGVLARALGNRSRRTIILVTALVFALFHVLGLDPNQFLASAAVVLPQLFIVGTVLAWVTLRSGRLGPAIFLHSGFNLLAAIALLLPPEVLESIG